MNEFGKVVMRYELNLLEEQQSSEHSNKTYLLAANVYWNLNIDNSAAGYDTSFFNDELDFVIVQTARIFPARPDPSADAHDLLALQLHSLFCDPVANPKTCVDKIVRSWRLKGLCPQKMVLGENSREKSSCSVLKRCTEKSTSSSYFVADVFIFVEDKYIMKR